MAKPKGSQIWGLTGGIASGKSLAAKFFAEAGIPVIDADQITRELSSPGGLAEPAIIQRFGTSDRAELRKIVFSDPLARKDLEAILHPLIQEESRKRMAGLEKVIYEATLLVETGRYRDLTGLIVVEAPRELRKQRLIKRDGHSPEMAEQILQAQLSDDERRRVATHILTNSGSPEDLRAKVLELIARL